MSQSLISNSSPATATKKRACVYLALSQIEVVADKKKEVSHQEACGKNLEIMKSFLNMLGRKRIGGGAGNNYLTVNTSTCNEEAYDQAFVHLRSPINDGSTAVLTTTTCLQLQLPRHTFKGNREQHFFVDVMNSPSDAQTFNEDDTGRRPGEGRGCAEECFSMDIGEDWDVNESKSVDWSEEGAKTSCDARDSASKTEETAERFASLTIDTSQSVNLDAEKWFKQANRFDEKLRPQNLSAGFDKHLIAEDEAAEKHSETILESVQNHRDENSDSYRGQTKAMQELHQIEMRRVQQEEEIQELLLRSKEHAERLMKRVVRYLTDNDFKLLAKAQMEKALLRRFPKKEKKKKKKKVPRWLQLYEDSKKRSIRAKQRSMKIKKASTETMKGSSMNMFGAAAKSLMKEAGKGSKK